MTKRVVLKGRKMLDIRMLWVFKRRKIYGHITKLLQILCEWYICIQNLIVNCLINSIQSHVINFCRRVKYSKCYICNCNYFVPHYKWGIHTKNIGMMLWVYIIYRQTLCNIGAPSSNWWYLVCVPQANKLSCRASHAVSKNTSIFSQRSAVWA